MLTTRFAMRAATLFLGAGLALLFLAGSARSQDDTDKVVFKKKASEWLTILRTDKQVIQRRRALIALNAAGPHTRKVFDGLGTALREDTEEIVRRTAAQVIGQLGAKVQEGNEKVPLKAGVDALAFAVRKDKSPTVREAAANALGRISAAGEPMQTPPTKDAVGDLAAALKDSSLDVRAAAADALGALGPHAKEAVAELAQAVRDNKDQVRVRSYAVIALGRIGTEARQAIPALVEILNEKDLPKSPAEPSRAQAELRRAAVEALGAIRHPSALDPLATFFEKRVEAKDATLAQAAISAINRFGLERRNVLPVLVKALAPGQDTEVRCQAMHAVSQLGRDLGSSRKTVITELRRGMKDKVSEVRLAAILGLGELGPEVLGDDLDAIKAELKLASRSGQKAIDEAAAAALKQLSK
jgi:HEAT repeat protein